MSISQDTISEIRNTIDNIYTEEYNVYSDLIKKINDNEELKVKHNEIINIFNKILTNLIG